MNCAAKIENFGPVWGASGVQGFFGDGYWTHRIPFRKPNFQGMVFTSKTTTMPSRLGNMPLNAQWQPKQLFPKCIRVFWSHDVVQNAVSLSGHGAKAMFDTGRLQSYPGPLWVSFMSLETQLTDRLYELRQFINLFKLYLPEFQSVVGLQINFSCPNIGKDLSKSSEEEMLRSLEMASELEIPTVTKIAALSRLFPASAILAIERQGIAKGICDSNTIKYDDLPDHIKRRVFKNHNPLPQYGGGGMSGEPLRPLVLEHIRLLREAGCKLHINGCGGILKPEHVDEYKSAGANSISIGSVAILHPRRVQSIIQRAHQLRWETR